ncbi:hypothetical protein BACPU_15790 [Bacillus pumilus]|nr:hypothetical protein BACPU_15790 [Bacillus pumilus]
MNSPSRVVISVLPYIGVSANTTLLEWPSNKYSLRVVVTIPLISKEIGKLMRTVTPDTSLKFELIHSSYSEEPTEGIMVIEKNEILYISTREAQLIRIKDEKYRTEPVQ